MNKIKAWINNHSGLILGLVGLVMLLAVFFVVYNSGPGERREVFFSIPSGFYKGDIEIELSSDGFSLPGAEKIVYNLNGDDIREDRTVYGGPIKLAVPEENYRVYTIAAAYCYGDEKCGRTFVATYVLGKNLDEDVDLNIVSITSSRKNLYDYETGIMAQGKTYDDAISNGDDGITAGNFRNRGEEWMRSSHVAMFDKGGHVLWNKDVGLEISGGTSSAMEVKSLKISTDPRFEPGSLPFDFGDGAKKYNSIRFRAGGQDQNFGNIRSSLVSRLAEESGFLGCTKTARAVVFLNNNYYGIFDVQQNYSGANIAKMFGLSDSNAVEKYRFGERMVLENTGIMELFTADLTQKENMEALEEKVDMDNYLTYFALQSLWNNTDWPSQNFEMWKYNGKNTSLNEYEDGRFRFLIYDTDLVYYRDGNKKYFEGAIGDQLAALMENKYKASGSLFSNVMKSSKYKTRFAEIVKELMIGSFKTSNVLKLIDEEAAKIDKQVQNFNTDEKYEEWKSWIDLMKQAVREREAVIRADMEKYFGVTI